MEDHGRVLVRCHGFLFMDLDFGSAIGSIAVKGKAGVVLVSFQVYNVTKPPSGSLTTDGAYPANG
ncbi:MAG: hypothetical protein ACOC10_05605 [Bacteroidota bacterium]